MVGQLDDDVREALSRVYAADFCLFGYPPNASLPVRPLLEPRLRPLLAAKHELALGARRQRGGPRGLSGAAAHKDLEAFFACADPDDGAGGRKF